jgi:hypothetical protein
MKKLGKKEKKCGYMITKKHFTHTTTSIAVWVKCIIGGIVSPPLFIN